VWRCALREEARSRVLMSGYARKLRSLSPDGYVDNEIQSQVACNVLGALCGLLFESAVPLRAPKYL